MKALYCNSLAFLIFLGSLMPNMDMEELAKIPNLVHHYYEHLAQNEDSNFLEFIDNHYHKASKKNSESSEHQKLPFFEHSAPNLIFLKVADFYFNYLQYKTPQTFIFQTKFTYFFLLMQTFFKPPRF